MQYPLNADLVYTALNPVIWDRQGNQGFTVGGGFSTVVGIPSQQLQASTNTVLGYFNGQMLARSNGDGTGDFAGQIAGALINFDPNSTDTGQAVWNGFIIADEGLKNPLPLLDDAGNPYVFTGTLNVAIPSQSWVIRQQYLYAGSTPSADATVVNTAVTSAVGFNCVQTQASNSSNASEVIFSY